MRALIWIAEETWRACVGYAQELLPEQAEVTLLHVAPSDVEELAAAGPAGLLGRRRRPPHERDLRTVSDEEARRLLDAARTLLGRDCTTAARRGRVEREVVTAKGVVSPRSLAICAAASRAKPGTPAMSESSTPSTQSCSSPSTFCPKAVPSVASLSVISASRIFSAPLRLAPARTKSR